MAVIKTLNNLYTYQNFIIIIAFYFIKHITLT